MLELHEAGHKGAACKAVGSVQPPDPGPQHIPQELEALAVHALLDTHAEEERKLLAEIRGDAPQRWPCAGRSSKEHRPVLPYEFSFLGRKNHAKQPNSPLNVFPMSPVFVTAAFLVEKVLKTANFPNSRKVRFFLSDGKRGASVSISAFCPEKLASSIPLSLSPLVTASSPLSFEKVRKNDQVPDFPEDFVLHKIFRFFAQATSRARKSLQG